MTVKTPEKVILAEYAATVHVSLGPVQENSDGSFFEPHESRVLEPGETLNLSEVTGYLRDLIEKGEAPGLALLTETQAKRRIAKANKIKEQNIALIDDDEDE